MANPLGGLFARHAERLSPIYLVDHSIKVTKPVEPFYELMTIQETHRKEVNLALLQFIKACREIPELKNSTLTIRELIIQGLEYETPN